MAQYIDKSVVVAEIDRRIADNKKDIERASHKNLEDYFEGYEDALALFKQQFLDTLEVKEVDLEKEIQSWVEDNSVNGYYREDVYETAEHFFKLGLKAQKE